MKLYSWKSNIYGRWVCRSKVLFEKSVKCKIKYSMPYWANFSVSKNWSEVKSGMFVQVGETCPFDFRFQFIFYICFLLCGISGRSFHFFWTLWKLIKLKSGYLFERRIVDFFCTGDVMCGLLWWTCWNFVGIQCFFD